ncbi:STAS domain-containing protein [Pedococcus bigeumensis]|uniref:STAS domain-containing protein n=1 Tax=Pedococcus bigeumensis TaxID=433644 RepID=UPI001386DD94|nr:STAS domain-containing protein [Pedococcus bigeumensis]
MNPHAHVRGEDLAGVDGTRVVRVEGEVDLANAHDVLDLILGRVSKDTTHVVLDLSATTYLDSSGVAMVFRLADRLGTSRQELRLVVPDGSPIRAVIELTSVDRVVRVDTAVSDAADRSR